MPILPRFSLTQDDEYVFIKIIVPHVRVSSAEIEIENSSFTFYCAPYLLKLTLPGELLDDERANATYDVEKDGGTLFVKAPKATFGQIFEDLDLVTRLLQPPAKFPERSRLEPIIESSKQHIISSASTISTISTISTSLSSSSSSSLDGVDSELSQMLMGTTISEPIKRRIGKEIKPKIRPMIEVIDSKETTEGILSINTNETSKDNNNNNVNNFSSSESLLSFSKPLYGFNRSFSNFFADLREEIQSGVTALPEPDSTSHETRPALRVIKEEEDWDVHRYCGDLFLDGEPDPFFIEALTFIPYWIKMKDEKSDSTLKAHIWDWTETEAEELASLPNREYLIDGKLIGGRLTTSFSSSSSSSSSSFLLSNDTNELTNECFNLSKEPELSRILSGLISILVAYSYDYRITGGEATVESGWTIATISPLLSWLDDIIDPSVWVYEKEEEKINETTSSSFSLLEAVSVACVRRMLCYPYIRRWDLAMLALSDCVMILLKGRRTVLRALLAIRRIFKTEDARYLLNKLFMDDMCVWVQAVDSIQNDQIFHSLGASLSITVQRLSKSTQGLSHWNLEESESRAISGLDPLGEVGEAEEAEEEEEEEEEEEDSDDDDSEDSDD